MNSLTSAKNTCFIGNRGIFSATVFRMLLEQGASITRVFCTGVAPVPIPETNLSVTPPTNEETLDSLANRHGIPVNYITKRTELSSLDLQQYNKPDFVLVACFPYTLPESVILWPASGCLNIHPSLLPRYRGPDPLFWQLHNGETQTGVSLHLVTPNIDSGPIIKQKDCPLSTGAKRQTIEKTLAEAGANLYLELLATENTLSELSQQQDASKASYDPYPGVENFEVSTNWSAQRAFNFIRGSCSPNGYFIVNTNNRSLKIISALDYSDDGNLPSDLQTSKEELLIQFSPGILRTRPLTTTKFHNNGGTE